MAGALSSCLSWQWALQSLGNSPSQPTQQLAAPGQATSCCGSCCEPLRLMTRSRCERALAPHCHALPACLWWGLVWRLHCAGVHCTGQPAGALVLAGQESPVSAAFLSALISSVSQFALRATPPVQSGTLQPNAFLEALGCLAQLDIPDFSYAEVLRSTGLHNLLARLAAGGDTGAAAAGANQAALLLEVVQAIGVLCGDEACASILAAAGLVGGFRWRYGRSVVVLPFYGAVC